MRNKIAVFIMVLVANNAFSQVERCGSVKNLEYLIQLNPNIKSKLDSIESTNSEWIKKTKRGFKEHNFDYVQRNITPKHFHTIENTNALCSFDNIFFASINAPTSLGQIVSPVPNCTYGGEYIRVNNLIAGNTYRISTIGLNNFDTVITIYSAGGGNPVAYNDDWSTSIQSEIYFTPFDSGNYDILINQFPCLSNQICASLQVELWNIPRPLITIPVVVHVMHKGEPVGVGTNISEAQILSQIDALNQDFRRQNNNILFSPPAFRGSSADPLIQFCLALRKPDGTPTNGIMRYPEPSQQYFDNINIPGLGALPSNLHCLNLITLKWFQSETIWNRDNYLNIWVSDLLKQLPPDIDPGGQGCEINWDMYGLAQFPGLTQSPGLPEPSLTDGIWVTTSAFGTIGNLQVNYNFGRTASHEVGHWFNLKHIWGDEPFCNQDDLVIDTPLQALPSYECLSFPTYDICTPSPLYPGIMFMNHMDYSFDNCRSIFTYGQAARMDSALFNQRVSLISSDGCQPSTLSSNNNIYENEIIVFPNPFKNQLNIDAFQPIEKIEIFNILGQLVKSFEISKINSTTIDLNELTKGNYIAKIYFEINQTTIKLIKD